MTTCSSNKLNNNKINQITYPNILVIDLTENKDKPLIYIQKDYRNLSLKEDGLKFIEDRPTCSGCYPTYQCNQLAHMDYGGCLYNEDY